MPDLLKESPGPRDHLEPAQKSKPRTANSRISRAAAYYKNIGPKKAATVSIQLRSTAEASMNLAALFLLNVITGVFTVLPQSSASSPSFDYEIARQHELKPHRRTVPIKGVQGGFNQLSITLTVAPTGDVIEAELARNDELIKFWPTIKAEVMQWKFTPFEENGKPVIAQVEEVVDLVPPEHLPKNHVVPPLLRRDSKIAIMLVRTGCFGTCPSYTVTIRNDSIVFNGNSYVVASGRHTDTARPEDVRGLARKFIAADFYSMNEAYRASVTDNPTYVLSMDIDGRKKEVEDYVGSWVGMPGVIPELENAVDSFARTDRWINGAEGLATALQLEGYNFQTFEAQLLFKEALMRGQTATVRELLAAGVPLKPIPALKLKEPGTEAAPSYERAGWLASASNHPGTLQVLIAAGASRNDQNDKDMALAGTARAGHLDAVRALIAYGSDPNADLSQRRVVESSGGVLNGDGPGAGSILIYAAESGNPDVVREILSYHPKLEMRDWEGRTAIFHAGDYRYGDKDGARVECVRLLAQAGANVNARDKDGNTPLHGIFLTDVEEELLQLGADVNARNNEGETPIFTNVDNDSIPLFIAHGADLTIRNNAGETVVEAAKKRGPQREAALEKAMLNVKPH
jgi:ankyrin repeat protein